MLNQAQAKEVAANQEAPVQFEVSLGENNSLYGYYFQQFMRAGFESKGACTREMNAHARRGLSSHLQNA